MDHETAVTIRAAERYWCGELPAEERDQFEEHYFTCPECAEEVRWEQIFAANARALFRDQERREEARPKPGWLAWARMRPWLAASAAANAVLFVAVGYQAARVVPQLRSELAGATEPALVTAVAVPTTVRGDAAPVTISRANRVAALSFILPRPFPDYSYEVAGESGPVRLAGVLAAPAGAADEILLTLPTRGLRPGLYRVTLSGVEQGRRVEIGRSRLQIQ